MFAMTVDGGQSVSVTSVDQDIVDAKLGDRDAIGRLVSSLESYLLTVAKRKLSKRVHVRVTPEDVVQSAMVSIIESIGNFNGSTMAELAGWCGTIVQYASLSTNQYHLDTQRRSVRHEATAVADYHSTTNDSPSHDLEVSDEFGLVLGALDQLSSDQAEAVRLRYLEGLDRASICDRMGKESEQVHSLLVRGMANLRKYLGA